MVAGRDRTLRAPPQLGRPCCAPRPRGLPMDWQPVPRFQFHALGPARVQTGQTLTQGRACKLRKHQVGPPNNRDDSTSSHGKKSPKSPESTVHAGLGAHPGTGLRTQAQAQADDTGSRLAAAQTHSLTPLTGSRSKSGAVAVLPLQHGTWHPATGLPGRPALRGPLSHLRAHPSPGSRSSPQEASAIRGAPETHPLLPREAGQHLPPSRRPELGIAWPAARQGSGSPASFSAAFATNGKSRFPVKPHGALSALLQPPNCPPPPSGPPAWPLLLPTCSCGHGCAHSPAPAAQ